MVKNPDNCEHKNWELITTEIQRFPKDKKQVTPQRCKSCGVMRDLIQTWGANRDQYYTQLYFPKMPEEPGPEIPGKSVEVLPADSKPEETIVKDHNHKTDVIPEKAGEENRSAAGKRKKRGPYRRSKGDAYYLEHKEEIKADHDKDDMTIHQLLEIWGMPRAVWHKLKDQIIDEVTEQPTKGETTGPETSSKREEIDIRGNSIADAGSVEISGLKDILEPMTPARRRLYYIEHKEEIMADAREMSNSAIMKKWLMGKDGWLSLRRLWGLPVNSPTIIKLYPALTDLMQLIEEVAAESSTIEEFRAFLKGYKRGKGWTQLEEENGNQPGNT